MVESIKVIGDMVNKMVLVNIVRIINQLNMVYGKMEIE